ncbi:unnamed protein product [Urochloa decumbens]|uniref:F-box associated beta-propeller type 3 domain-containing protein n=1 Tax=Urochloa decumbens TaxID=240449 RepID=A0ABC9D2M4_9POAL
MEKKAGEDEIVVEDDRGTPAAIASSPKKRKTQAAAAVDGARLCDDVLGLILARLPARAAVACTALSKRHRRLILTPEFRSLLLRLSPPLPRPHVAYVATAPLRWKGEKGLVSVSHGFHVAAAGGRIAAAPMRALFGQRYSDDRYVNTCNGVVLLATNDYTPQGRCVLWNPAVADVVRDVTVPDPSKYRHYLVLGLGYGRRSKTYKILLCRKDYWQPCKEYPSGSGCNNKLNTGPGLQVYALGRRPQLRTISSTEIHSQAESLYLDGMLFVLDGDKSVILAFDVDDETITTIHLPGDQDPIWHWPRHVRSTLMEMDGRVCVVTKLGHQHRAGLWLLTADHQWERRCVIELEEDLYHRDDEGNMYDCSVTGIWNCGGVLAVYIQGYTAANDRLRLYQLATEKMLFDAKLPCDLVPEHSKYALCWGYKPTLVAPQSIVELSQDEERRRNNAAGIMEALKPINDKDIREGKKAILDTVYFMEFLVSIMRKLPDGLQDVIKLPLLESKVSDLVSDDNDSEDSEDAARDAFEIEIVSGSEADSD